VPLAILQEALCNFTEVYMEKGVLKNDSVQVEYLKDALRISGLRPAGKSNLLVQLAESVSVPAPYGNFYFRGGHRLWSAP